MKQFFPNIVLLNKDKLLNIKLVENVNDNY